MNRKHIIIIIILYLLTQAVFITSELITSRGGLGFPLDDTWIHLRFAENFWHGHFFQFNIGEPTPGTTSPLWVILLSIGFIFSSTPIIYSILLNSLFFLLTCFGIYNLSLRLGLNENTSLFITVLVLLCGRMDWCSVSGMEVTLFCFLTIWVVMMHLKEIELKKINILTGLLLGLATATRPEGYLFAPIYYLITILIFRKVLKGNFGKLILSVLIYILLVIPYPIFSYIYADSFLPNTYRGLHAGFRFLPDIVYLRETGKLFFKDNLIILILWITSSLYFFIQLIRKKSETKYLFINLWIILLPAVSSILIPNWRHYGRYLIPLIPFIYLIVIKFVADLQEKKNLLIKKYYNYLRMSFISIVLLLSFVSVYHMGYIIGWNVDNIYDQQGSLAEWVNTNLSDEKAIGLNDIGIITFKTKKKIFDMEGLVSPEVFKSRKLGMDESSEYILNLLKKNNVNYLFIYPQWYEFFMQKYSNGIELVHSAKLEKNTICGGEEMFVYKINWGKIQK